MNYSIIPFGDGNWDYGVVKTFLQKESVFVINEPNILSLYSGWPLLHTFAAVLSSVSGLDAFHLALLLPSIISITSFMFVYLLVEIMRKALKLDTSITPIALLIYTVSPDSIFWPMQFVRQNIGILLFTVILYLIVKSVGNPSNPKYRALLFFFIFPLVIGHHFTSFIAVVYLFLFSAFSVIGKRFGKDLKTDLWHQTRMTLLNLMLVAFSALFVWWNYVATMVWPYIISGIERLSRLIMGIREVEFLPRQASYPTLLTPPWVSSLLLLRDILIYLPVFFGLLIIAKKAPKASEKFFLVYSTLAFASVIILDNLIFKIGTIRIVAISLPILVLLSAVLYSYIQNKLKHIWKISITATLVATLLFSSFIGLWGHNFAPLHLYDPNINSAEIGERNKDFIRIADFQARIPIRNFDIVWADDRSPLLLLLEPEDYSKIRWLPNKDVQKLGTYNHEIVCVFKDLNLYFYHAGIFSPVDTPEDAKIIKRALEQRLENKFNCIYNDGKYDVWST
jgi:hypothetical protein